MKRFEIPMVVMSLFGFCFLWGPETPTAYADFTFGQPTNLGPTVNSTYDDYGAVISPDGLELYFCSDRPGGYGGYDIWVTKRASIEYSWGPPANLGSQINTSGWDAPASISADGLVLYSQLGSSLCTVARATLSAPWGPPVRLPSAISTGGDAGPRISGDGLELYFVSQRSGGYGNWDTWLSTRATTSDPWAPSVNLGATINTPYIDICSWISPDGLMLLFFSNRPGGFGAVDVWMTTREAKGSPWTLPRNLGSSINTSDPEFITDISPDGRWCYVSDFGLWIWGPRPGGLGWSDLWEAPIIPIADFNSDGIVDAADVVIMVEHWLTDYPLCDIGPMPWGDGIVDVEDLVVLAEHLFENELAHWKLDEAEGMVAHDSVGNNDAFVIGVPVWQPTGGQVNGALQLDGIDDCAVTNPVLSPAEGPFSVLVWVKGGAPGQAVLSQIGGASWLCADPLEGNLMTELKGPGQSSISMISQTVITDGNWHRIGLVWDGSHRKLFVDGVVVAEDTQAGLEGSDNGLYIGTGKAMEAGTYWSGLIDNVSIYNVALTAEEIKAMAQ